MTITSQWECFLAALSAKASPYEIRPWAQLSQTLDGRDKITKLLQYTARFLAFYYDSLARYYKTWRQRQGDRTGSPSSLSYYQFQAVRFRKLQKALSDARKAFGLGRSWVEYQKLKDMGGLPWINLIPQNIWKQINSVISIIPPSIPSNMSITLTAFRNYLQSFPQVVQHTNPPPFSWTTVANSTRIASMIAFWAFDNIAFLSSAGFLDTMSLPFVRKEHNGNHPIPVGPIASRFANRIYFFSSLIHLATSWKDWKEHEQKTLRDAWNQYARCLRQEHCSPLKDGSGSTTTQENHTHLETMDTQEGNLQIEQWKHKWDLAQRQHCALFLNLVKNSCDVLVFANNTGVDIPLKLTGRKLNEGIHSLGGIISAIIVLIQSFPHAY